MFNYKKLLIRIVAFVVIFYSFTFFINRVLGIGLDEIQEFVASFGILAPLAYSIVLFLGLSVPFNPISDFLTINIGVVAFSPIVAIIFTFLAHSMALTVNYHVGKRYGKRVMNRFLDKKSSDYIQKYLDKLTIRNLFLIRFIVPISSMFGIDIISYVSGIQRLPFIKYYLASIVPWTILTSIYFTTSSYLLTTSIYLYFLPAILIAGIPIIILLVNNKIKRN